MAFDAERLVSLGRVGPVSPSPCGRWIAVQVDRLDADGAKYIGDLWRIDLEGDAPPHCLTPGAHPDRSPCWRADGALLFISDRPRDAKDETPRAQVWCLPAGGGDARPITDEPLGVDAFQLSRNGKVMVVRAKVWPGVPHAEQRAHDDARRDHGPSARRYTRLPVRFWDHWRSEAAPHIIAYIGGLRSDLTPDADGEHREAGWHLSADGSTVVVGRRRPSSHAGIEDQDLWVIGLLDGARTLLDAGPGGHLESPLLSPDGTSVVCIRYVRPHPPTYRPRLHRIEVASGAGRGLTTSFEAFPRPAAWSPDGTSILFTADDHGRAPIFIVDAQGGAPERLLDPSVGGSHTALQITRDGTRVVGTRSTFLQPPEPFVAPLTIGGDPLVVARLSGFDAAEAPTAVEELTVEGADGTPVHGFVVRPTDRGAPLPLLLWIHGGPMSQHADGWHWRWNAVLAAQAGFVVALPNPRGSTGYGQAFVDGVWNNQFGGPCYDDLMAFTDAACARDDVDATRTVAMGGSFGGLMTNLIGTRTDRFQALVSHAGLYDYRIFRSTTDDPGWFAYGFGFEPDDDPAAFDRHSPHAGVKDWVTPTLILHGDKDYRVPITEALALFEALQRRGVPSEFVMFPDENHWILRPKNVIAWNSAWIQFVARQLG